MPSPSPTKSPSDQNSGQEVHPKFVLDLLHATTATASSTKLPLRAIGIGRSNCQAMAGRKAGLRTNALLFPNAIRKTAANSASLFNYQEFWDAVCPVMDWGGDVSCEQPS